MEPSGAAHAGCVLPRLLGVEMAQPCGDPVQLTRHRSRHPVLPCGPTGLSPVTRAIHPLDCIETGAPGRTRTRMRRTRTTLLYPLSYRGKISAPFHFMCVLILWQFAQTMSHLAISSASFAIDMVCAFLLIGKDFVLLSLWSKSMQHDGNNPPQSWQGTFFTEAIKALTNLLSARRFSFLRSLYLLYLLVMSAQLKSRCHADTSNRKCGLVIARARSRAE